MERLNKRILVTGGAGFIGGHLVELLLHKGYQVTVVDIQKKAKTYFFLRHLDAQVDYRRIDIRNRGAVMGVFDKVRPAYVIHLAATAVVGEAYDDPRSAFETNIMGSVNILEACRACPTVKRIIVASSDKAYGKTNQTYTESSPLRGDHPYDVSKSCEDLIAFAYHKTYGLPVVITRFGNVYGEGDMHFERIIPSICISLVSGNPLQIRSDGTFVRDYLYVKDVVVGYLTLLESPRPVVGQAYNFSSHDMYSVLELIKKVKTVLKKDIPYIILNTAKNEIPYQHLDDSKIRKLGWQNIFNLTSTMKSIVEWYGTIV